jgi:phosphatidylinositol 3-kinase
MHKKHIFLFENFLFSCTLEGIREKPNYKDVIAKPILRYSGVFEHSDLYVTCQIYANNQELCMPIKTSYKFIEKQYCWDEWLTLPLRISDLPKNSLLTITAWDLYTSDQDIPVAGSTIPLFDKYGYVCTLTYLPPMSF